MKELFSILFFDYMNFVNQRYVTWHLALLYTTGE